jgi:hypothetical protein
MLTATFLPPLPLQSSGLYASPPWPSPVIGISSIDASVNRYAASWLPSSPLFKKLGREHSRVSRTLPSNPYNYASSKSWGAGHLHELQTTDFTLSNHTSGLGPGGFSRSTVASPNPMFLCSLRRWAAPAASQANDETTASGDRLTDSSPLRSPRIALAPRSLSPSCTQATSLARARVRFAGGFPSSGWRYGGVLSLPPSFVDR